MNYRENKFDLVSPAIVFTGLVAVMAVIYDWNLLIRSFLVIIFLLTSPGGAYIHLLRIKNPVVNFTLSVAFSLVLDASVALIMLYLHQWSPLSSMVILYYLSLVGIVLKIFTRAPNLELNQKS
jgi:hypothetical protein